MTGTAVLLFSAANKMEKKNSVCLFFFGERPPRSSAGAEVELKRNQYIEPNQLLLACSWHLSRNLPRLATRDSFSFLATETKTTCLSWLSSHFPMLNLPITNLSPFLMLNFHKLWSQWVLSDTHAPHLKSLWYDFCPSYLIFRIVVLFPAFSC